MQHIEYEPAKLSDFDREHVGPIVGDVFSQRFSNFSAQLLRLIAKADLEQREVLRRVYPDHVAAFEAWHDGPNE